MQILVVEDEPKVGQALREGLESEGYEITLARTGEEALVNRIPAWMGLWFSVFPTFQALAAHAIAALVVLEFYIAARK